MPNFCLCLSLASGKEKVILQTLWLDSVAISLYANTYQTIPDGTT